MDSSLLHYVIQLRRPWLDDVMLLASALGAGGFIWWVTAVIAMLFPNRRAAAWRMLLAGVFTWAVCEYALKPAFDSPRPFELDATIPVIDARPTTGAFPSGHAAIAVAYALAGSRMFPGSAWLWYPLAVLVAISRVYIGVHWPSDVVGGALVGLACAWFALGGRSPKPALAAPQN